MSEDNQKQLRKDARAQWVESANLDQEINDDCRNYYDEFVEKLTKAKQDGEFDLIKTFKAIREQEEHNEGQLKAILDSINKQIRMVGEYQLQLQRVSSPNTLGIDGNRDACDDLDIYLSRLAEIHRRILSVFETTAKAKETFENHREKIHRCLRMADINDHNPFDHHDGNHVGSPKFNFKPD